MNSILAVLLTFSLLLMGCGAANESSASGNKTETPEVSAEDENKDASEAEKATADEERTDESKETQETAEKSDSSSYMVEAEDAPEIEGLSVEGQLKLDYAEGFDVYYYEGGYALMDVYDSAQYMIVPDGMEVPENISEDTIVLLQPLDKIYLAATSAMALFRGLDSLGNIRLTGTESSGWYVQEAAEAMDNGDMLFAGKYSEPDYELLVDENCNLAIESTMILHSPKVQEMIEMLDIPVFIDHSSYETHPLGRTEWIKAYGVMMDKEEEAQTFFDKQAEVIEQLKDFTNTEKTVVFFYVSTDGSVVVRKSDDYIPKMIEIAGGRYIFDNLQNEESTSASVSLTMEEFYATAADADYIIYNGTIDNPISSVDELLAKSELFSDFKAVKEGNVWTIGKDLYQATDIVGNMILDVNHMLTGENSDEMTFLTKVD
ncbi:MAG: ABC transporter substrate-binding protein [Lachnospiraceae bacterium]|nr:ABC transporter substrate-binding protein [Lachnospiraceae bacterium]MDD3615982.1 ABC transporter substrate-binding protein [Lachnospiraceae bacterium]